MRCPCIPPQCHLLPPFLPFPLFIHTDLLGDSTTAGSSVQTTLPFPGPRHSFPHPHHSDLCSYVTSSSLPQTSDILYHISMFDLLQSTYYYLNAPCSPLVFLPIAPLTRSKFPNSRDFTVLWSFVLFRSVSLYFILIYNKRTKIR